MASEMNSMPAAFGPTLKFHMDRKNLTQDKLAERTYISPVSISKHQPSGRKYYARICTCVVQWVETA